MKAIVSVVGKDRIGIIAGVCGALAEHNVNILDISQTILQDYFNMIMIVSIPDTGLEAVQGALKSVSELLGVEVKVQSDAIFQAMHRI